MVKIWDTRSYINYDAANNKVSVPNYNDRTDAVANAIIQNLYPTRTSRRYRL